MKKKSCQLSRCGRCEKGRPPTGKKLDRTFGGKPITGRGALLTPGNRKEGHALFLLYQNNFVSRGPYSQCAGETIKKRKRASLLKKEGSGVQRKVPEEGKRKGVFSRWKEKPKKKKKFFLWGKKGSHIIKKKRAASKGEKSHLAGRVLDGPERDGENRRKKKICIAGPDSVKKKKRANKDPGKN